MQRKHLTVPSVNSSIPQNIRYIAKSENVSIGKDWQDVDLLNLHEHCYFFENCDDEIMIHLKENESPFYDDAIEVEQTPVEK